MSRPIVLHLVDDTTAGGVTRVVDHIVTSPELARDACHRRVVLVGKRPRVRYPEADIIVSHQSVKWANLPHFVALRLCNPRARLIHVEHSYTEAFVRRNVAKKARFHRLLRLTYGLFDAVAAVSHGQADWLSRIGAVAAKKLVVIRSFVDLSDFAALAPAEGPIRVIGAIGRLEPQKGFDDLIRSFRASSRADLELHIYGTGAEEAALTRLAGGDPRIRFMGFVPDTARAMERLDAVVMPSRWEAYGLVAIEALAAGRPLFVNGIDGLSDHVTHGALEVPTDGPDAWRAVFDTMPDRVEPPRDRQTLRELKTDFLTSWRAQVSAI